MKTSVLEHSRRPAYCQLLQWDLVLRHQKPIHKDDSANPSPQWKPVRGMELAELDMFDTFVVIGCSSHGKQREKLLFDCFQSCSMGFRALMHRVTIPIDILFNFQKFFNALKMLSKLLKI